MTFLKKIWKTNIKNQMVLMLFVLTVANIFQQELKHVLPQILISVFTAAGLDLLINYIKSRKVFFPTSAVISGLIISLVLTPDASWYIPIAAAVIAIGSKHIIRIKGRHIFNPANFGLLVSMFVFKTYLTWWGANIPWLVIILGAVIVYRFKRTHLAISFLLTNILLLGLYYTMKGQPVLNAVFMANMFFALVMLIEPKTSPLTKKGRVKYGILTAGFSFLFIVVIPQYDPSVMGLALANILVPVINRKKLI